MPIECGKGTGYNFFTTILTFFGNDILHSSWDLGSLDFLLLVLGSGLEEPKSKYAEPRVQGAAKVKCLSLPVSILVRITADLRSLEWVMCYFFENPSTVQLDHQILATAILFSIGCLWWSTTKLDKHPCNRSLIESTVGMASRQVTLGILTLLSFISVSLGTAYQAGAFALLTLMILLNHIVRRL
ncbi:hypothetical protein Pfo_027277 [Paulownia fortunei]|nr:hypothetical protein Pfo_027277 [Paulownia fortunei]